MHLGSGSGWGFGGSLELPVLVCQLGLSSSYRSWPNVAVVETHGPWLIGWRTALHASLIVNQFSSLKLLRDGLVSGSSSLVNQYKTIAWSSFENFKRIPSTFGAIKIIVNQYVLEVHSLNRLVQLASCEDPTSNQQWDSSNLCLHLHKILSSQKFIYIHIYNYKYGWMALAQKKKKETYGWMNARLLRA
jgi:hypothetical protein